MTALIKGGRNITQPSIHSLLSLSSLIAALFFSGAQFWLLSISLIFLLTWGCIVALRLQTATVRIPTTALALSLTLFWLWLALSIAWSKVQTVSFIQFWWISAFPLAFWAYTIDSERNIVWEYAAKGVLFISLLLAFFSIYQFFALHEQARSLFITRNSHAAFLNLAALPASAYFLIAHVERKDSWGRILILAAALYSIFFSIALTTSRGATLSLLIAMAWLAVASVKRVRMQGLLTLFSIVLAAFATSHLIQLIGYPVDTRPSLFEAHNRMIIWESAWRMLMDAPWFGIGLGVYFLAWPPYRNPADESSGFFVHNDYLQLWIETGLPGLILLFTILLLVLAALWKTYRNVEVPSEKKIEATGLFCGLLTVATHSFVDFNFYVISIMITAGLVLGRFHQLAPGYHITPAWYFQPKFTGYKIYPLVVIFITLVPVVYLASQGLGDSFAKKAQRQAAEGLLEDANRSFKLAGSFAPWDDRILSAHADLYRQGIPLLPLSDSITKKTLFDSAIRLLNKAEEIDPLRWNTFAIRGKLYRDNATYMEGNSREMSKSAFKQALALNPTLYSIRTDYAELLLQNGEVHAANSVLYGGITYTYPNSPDLIPYYSMTMALLNLTGKPNEAKKIEEKLVRQRQLFLTESSYPHAQKKGTILQGQ